MTYTYDQDLFTAIITLDGATYTYHEVSPYHWERFCKMLRRNFGRAMSYLRGFRCTKGKEA